MPSKLLIIEVLLTEKNKEPNSISTLVFLIMLLPRNILLYQLNYLKALTGNKWNYVLFFSPFYVGFETKMH